MDGPSLEAEVAEELGRAFRRELRRAKRAALSGRGPSFSPLLTFQDVTALAVREIRSSFWVE